ncbi:uncharacterized protein LOC119649570 isoform X2 [Hermetia illucens]|uniref:uncharacterized protein LOC119649570 isoform X2 n=1 Tax=Hermetia illucens TaxID=343691 RepID=UPI0018CC51FB|nr:uncharacterized protein LOC119649570 isoform X2 [Hermetia illucens]
MKRISTSPTAEGESRPEIVPLSRAYRTLSPRAQILSGSYSQGNKIFGLQSRNKQSPATCIVAAVYSKVIPSSSWIKKDIHRILELGDKLYRTSVTHIPLKSWQVLKPHCVHPTFYIGQNKITVFVGNDVITGVHTPDNPVLPELLASEASHLNEKHDALIFNIHDKNFAIWKEQSKAYLFCPHDADDDGLPAKVGTGKSFVMRADAIENFAEHLSSFINGQFSLYSLKILKLIELKNTMSGLIAQIQESEALPDTEPEEKKSSTEVVEAESHLPPGYTKDLLETERQFDLKVTSNFKPIDDTQGSLLHNAYEHDADLIVCDTLAALVMLHRKHSSTWNVQTIAEILSLGKDISDHDFDIETHIAGYMEVIAYEKTYRIEFEKVVYGQVTSQDENVPTVLTGVEMFFKNYDVGLIFGPQNIAIWKEKGMYFAFDPKERDALGRKWTKMLSKQLGPPKKGGGACVVWYKNPRQLAERYISNVPVKHRNDAFRIINIHILESPQGDDWEEWTFVKPGEWILQGDDALCKYLTPEEVDKKAKSLAVACYILAFTTQKPEDEWSSETLTNLLKDGIEYYKTLVQDAQPHLANSPNSMTELQEPKRLESLAEFKKNVTIDGNKILLKIDECVISNKDVLNVKGSSMLKAGLEVFFKSYRSGIITCGESILTTWTDGEAYYVLDFAEKMNIEQTLTKTSNNQGKITAVRFEKLSDMLNVITSNPRTLGYGEFCISRVEATFEEGGDIPLRNYEAFLGKSAILTQPDYHEGHAIFGARADKQTLANLITALCLSAINNSAEWCKYDLVDIIRIGDRMYAKIIEDFSECEAKDHEIGWDDLQPQIGISAFTFNREEHTGILSKPVEQSTEPQPEPTVSIEQPMEDQEKGSKSISISNANDAEPNAEENAQEVSEELAPEPDTITTLLQNLDINPTYAAILQTDFVDIALWKQDGLYFVFDPKANDEKGYPSVRRIQKAVQVVQARLKAEEEERNQMRERDVSANKLEPEEGEDHPMFDDPYFSLDEIKAKTDEVHQHLSVVRDSQLALEKGEAAKETVRDIMSLPNDGAAYVAWFQTLEGLIDHLLSKTPPEYQNQPITLHVIQIDKAVIQSPQKTVKYFEERNPEGFWTLRGFISQEDPILPNRTNLDGACSIIALGFTLINPADEWSRPILDVILKFGDRLYTKSLMLVSSYDNKVKLKIGQLAKSFSIYKHKFDYELKFSNDKFPLNNPENFNEINSSFKEAVNRLGTSEKNIGVIANLNGNYCVAIWRAGPITYVYDSHQNDPNGVYKTIGSSTLERFANLNILFNVLRRKFDNIKEAIMCELIEVDMETTKSKAISPPDYTLVNFRVPEPQSAFITGEDVDTSTKILKVGQAKPEVSEVLLNFAAVVLSHLLHTECWTPTIMNKVFCLANNLQVNSTDIKLDVTIDKVEMDLKGLIRCFTIDNTMCTLNIDEIIRGPITGKNPTDVSLENSLNLLMRNYCRAIVITASYICAIWREEDTYYLFTAFEEDRPFVMSCKTQDKLLEWMIKNRPKDKESDWYQIVRVEIASIQLKDLPKASKRQMLLKPKKFDTSETPKRDKRKIKKVACTKKEAQFVENVFSEKQDIRDVSKSNCHLGADAAIAFRWENNLTFS